jgi:hypothetical protein
MSFNSPLFISFFLSFFHSVHSFPVGVRLPFLFSTPLEQAERGGEGEKVFVFFFLTSFHHAAPAASFVLYVSARPGACLLG